MHIDDLHCPGLMVLRRGGDITGLNRRICWYHVQKRFTEILDFIISVIIQVQKAVRVLFDILVSLEPLIKTRIPFWAGMDSTKAVKTLPETQKIPSRKDFLIIDGFSVTDVNEMQEVVFFIAPLFQLDLQCIECGCVVGDYRSVEIDIIRIDPAVKIEIDNPPYEEGSCGRDIPDYGLFVSDIDGFSTLIKVSDEGVEVIGIKSAGNLWYRRNGSNIRKRICRIGKDINLTLGGISGGCILILELKDAERWFELRQEVALVCGFILGF